MPTSTLTDKVPFSAGLPVHLEPDSLYISTIPLTQGFHWALIHVDCHGSATRHHWAATTNDPHGPEGYVCQPMPNGPRMKAGQQPILAYFKIPEYVPVDIPLLQDVCDGVFPGAATRASYSALQNRAANMSPRTWCTSVLARLLALSVQGPGAAQRAAEIEAFVDAHSCSLGDAYARAFLFRQNYSTVVLPVTLCASAVRRSRLSVVAVRECITDAEGAVHCMPSVPPSCVVNF
ncbi:hypothetical protein BD310DRAFT_825365 [Dichomitus squalens]|nr:hypothetical protein BD310DRAFT_825365 [Dichomitus squalens]